MRLRVFLPIIGCLVLMLGCGGGPAPEPVADEIEVAEAVADDTEVAERHDVVYVCNCGEDCTCGAVSVEAGTCSCGTELAQAHLVKVEGNEALLCTCGSDCSCSIHAEDPTMCSCGVALRRVSFEGTGVHFCNCGGGSCTCNHVAAAAGKCACGMDLSFAG